MSKLRITGKHLRNIDYPQGPVISVAINTMEKHYKHHALEEALGVLSNVLAEPAMFVEDKVLGNIAKMLLPKPARVIQLNLHPAVHALHSYQYPPFEHLSQMRLALHL